MSEFLQQIETAVGFKCWRVQVSHSTVSSRQSRSSFQEQRSGYGVTIDCTPFKAALEREAAWEGRPEHLFPPIYLGSLSQERQPFRWTAARREAQTPSPSTLLRPCLRDELDVQPHPGRHQIFQRWMDQDEFQTTQ